MAPLVESYPETLATFDQKKDVTPPPVGKEDEHVGATDTNIRTDPLSAIARALRVQAVITAITGPAEAIDKKVVRFTGVITSGLPVATAVLTTELDRLFSVSRERLTKGGTSTGTAAGTGFFGNQSGLITGSFAVDQLYGLSSDGSLVSYVSGALPPIARGLSSTTAYLDLSGRVRTDNVTVRFNNSGQLVAIGGGEYGDGGESKGTNRTLGQNDAFSFGLKTNNIVRVHIQSGGNVGVGPAFTAPDELFHISQAVDDGDVAFLIENSQANADTNETVSLKFGFGGVNDAARIRVVKQADFTVSGNETASLEFMIANAGVQNTQMKLHGGRGLFIGEPGAAFEPTVPQAPFHVGAEIDVAISGNTVALFGAQSGVTYLTVAGNTETRIQFGDTVNGVDRAHIKWQRSSGLRLVNLGPGGTSQIFLNENSLGIEMSFPAGGSVHITDGGSGNAPGADTRLTVGSNSGTNNIVIAAGSTQVAGLLFSTAGDEDRGSIEYDNPDNAMFITVATVEAIRIDSSQNVGIGDFSSNTIDEEFHIARAVDDGDVGFLIENSQANADTNETVSLNFGFGGVNTAARVQIGKAGIFTTSATEESFMKFEVSAGAGGLTEVLRLEGEESGVGKFAFFAASPTALQTGFTLFGNLTTVRTLDADATTLAEVADVLGTLVEDLKSKNLISA